MLTHDNYFSLILGIFHGPINWITDNMNVEAKVKVNILGQHTCLNVEVVKCLGIVLL